MEKKKWVKLAGFAMVFLLSLFLCVGCAENSAEDSDEVTFIDFSRESASSRGIESWNENLYPLESLYWTYKATKVRGNYTTGQTSEPKPVVKNGPATGLGTVGPFSVGVWEFELYGYAKCTENSTTGELVFAPEDLVYTGKTGTETHNYTTIDKRPEGVTDVQKIIFELTANPNFWEDLEGQLAINNLKLTVPEGQRISGTKPVSGKTGAEVVIKIWEGTPSDTNLPIAKSTSIISTDKESGSVLDSLSTPGFIEYSGAIKNKYSIGTHNFYIAAEYMDVFTKEQEAGAYEWSAKTDGTQYIYDDGYAPIGAIVSYPLAIKAGVKTTISGDINDIQVAEDDDAHDDVFTGAVVKILNNTRTAAEGSDAYDLYKSIADAEKFYGDSDHKTTSGSTSTPNPIIVIHNIDNGGSVALTKDLVVKVTDENGNRHFIENLTVSGDHIITFGLNYAYTTRDYKFSKGKIVNLSYGDYGKDTFIQTDDGTLDVNAPNDSVYHTGTADSVTITSVSKAAGKGYFLGTTKEVSTSTTPSTITSVSALTLAAGNLDLGSYTAVGTLTVTPTSTSVATIKGRTTTEVGNINTIRDTAYTGNIFKKVILNANGGTPATPVTKYGIEGMYMDLNFTTAPFTAPTSPAGLTFNCWNTKTDRSGTDVAGKVCVGSSDTNLYAVWGSPVAKIETTTAGVYGYFGTLHEAVLKYGTTGYGTNPVILLKDIDTDSIEPASTVKINPNGFSLKGITVTTASNIEIDVATDRVYTFGGVANNKLDEFSCNGAGVEIKTTNGNLTVDASGDVITHSGSIGSLNITDCETYNLNATATTATVNAGRVNIGGTVTTLNVPSGKTPVLKVVDGGSVTTCQYNGAPVSTWSTATTTYAPYRQLILDGNGGTLMITSPAALSGSKLYANFIEGTEITLPDVSTSTGPASTAVRDWNTAADGNGDMFNNKGTFVLNANTTLYARWKAKPVAKLQKGSVYEEFATLNDAIAKYGTSGYIGRIILMDNIASGYVTKAVEIDVAGYSLKNITAGENYSLTVHPETGVTDRTYVFGMSSGAKVNSFECNLHDVVYDTTGCSVSVDAASDSVWHTGTATNVTVTAVTKNKDRHNGYHLNTTGTVGTLTCVSGFVDMGENVKVTTLTIASADLTNVVLCGKSTTVVSNYEGTWKASTAVDGVASQTAFKKITLNGNGGTAVSGKRTVYYGIDGMYIDVLSAYKDAFTREGWAFEGWALNATTSTPVENFKFVVTGNTTVYARWSMNCLCFTTRVAGNVISMTHGASAPTLTTLKYSKDGGKTWAAFTPGTTTVTLDFPGDKVYFKGAESKTGTSGGDMRNSNAYGNIFMGTKDFDASGSVMSLLDGCGNSTTISQAYAFRGLFYGSTHLKSCPELPATTLKDACYNAMFRNCTGLVDASGLVLPAKNLPTSVYQSMFEGCTGLVSAPLILAERVTGGSALYTMFAGCSSLLYMQDKMYIVKGSGDTAYQNTFRGFVSSAKITKLPDFSGITVLASGDFVDAFCNCANLNYIKVGFTSWEPTLTYNSKTVYSTHQWFASSVGFPASGTFVCPSGLDTTEKCPAGCCGVPAGWTVVKY